ncbi:uncharacterized protein LOC124917409, partial [Impatiens glandulifera]|uniref:uncharacterized protein LOC124917409 n=1 Tax=Impatiens glandulifera TaxID=253017 RepID=UPI001FB0F928
MVADCHRPLTSGKRRQTESSGSKENKSVSKEEAEVSIHSETSKSPSKRIEEVIADVGLNTSKAIEDVIQDIARETEDDVSSRRKSIDQVEIPDQSEVQPVEETAKTTDITPPAQEGSVQVNKGKGVLIKDSTVTGKGTLQTGPQPEVVTGDEVTFTAEQEDEVFEELLRDMNKGESDAIAPYLMWVKLRCETKLSDMAPGLSGNKHWDRLIRLEERALQLAHTNLIQSAFSKTVVILEEARLQAVENAFQETKGATLTPIEMRMAERFIAVREKLVQNLDHFDMQWRKGCRSQLNNVDLHQISKTQEQIESDVETAKRVQDEERERERLQKEIEDKDYEFAQKCNEEEQANIQEPPPVQPSHSMNTRNKKKWSVVAKVIKRAEQRAVVPVVLNVQPLDEEEEEDIEELNQRKRRATEGSTATPNFRPIITPPLPPPKPVCASFGFNKKTPGHSS